MRPVLLELEGFGAFKQPATIDFDDTDFFALVGPTGSGKSTVVDAICFSLYGSVPRYSDERLVGSAMSAGHQEMKVRLTFEVGGRRYRAARVVRRDRHGRATTKEARLETAGGEVLAGRATEMAAAVERVLGLPYSHFVRCVVLPQGEFARFLHDRPAERQQLLVSLLDLRIYERLAQEANRRAGAHESTVKVADQQLLTLAAATPEALRSAQALAAQLTELVRVLDAAAPKLVELDEAIGAACREVALASELVRALEAVHVPGTARSLGADLAAARSALRGAELDREAAAAEVERASAALAGLPTPDSLRAALAIHDDLDGVRASLAQAEERHRQAAAAAAESGAVVANAERALAHAEALHEEARQRFAAHLLASGLEPGAPCPVCGQDVHEAVAIDPPADLGSRRERLDAARVALDAGRERHRRDEVVAERALATIEELQARAAAVEVRLGDDHDRGALVELVGRVTAVYEQVASARQREQQCAEVVTKGRQAVHDLQAEAAALGAGYHAQRDRVASLGPPVPGDDVLVAWDALAEWADHERPVQAATLDRAERSAAELTARRSMLVDALAAEASAAGVVAPPDVSQLHRAATHALARAAEQVAALERQIELAARLTIERDQAREAGAVAGELGRLLSARGFERWMVAEALQRLAYGASVTLRTLSGGQFSLVLGDDGEFSVTDHANGDEVRPVRTLSGGETFQASLALALALADQLSSLAASGAAKLDAMFLDEGFGTLDPESLDTVAATIESLGSAGRMVGIVTHVRELAARVPVRYEVRKGSATSTVERVAG